jgi:hypothetical protein
MRRVLPAVQGAESGGEIGILLGTAPAQQGLRGIEAIKPAIIAGCGA